MERPLRLIAANPLDALARIIEALLVGARRVDWDGLAVVDRVARQPTGAGEGGPRRQPCDCDPDGRDSSVYMGNFDGALRVIMEKVL